MCLVSIVIPTYNRSKLLMECINSIREQTYGNWECIVVDDYSSEDIKQVVISASNHDFRIRYLKNTGRRGAQGARNMGLKEAHGTFVIFEDSDDLLASNCLQKRIEFANKSPGRYFYCFPTAVFRYKPFDTPYLWNYLNKKMMMI